MVACIAGAESGRMLGWERVRGLGRKAPFPSGKNRLKISGEANFERDLLKNNRENSCIARQDAKFYFWRLYTVEQLVPGHTI